MSFNGVYGVAVFTDQTVFSVCFAVSVIFNEPLTFLQRVAEYMEYGQLLHTAASLDEPLHRLQVSCFISLLLLCPALSTQVGNCAEVLTIIDKFRLDVGYENVLEPDWWKTCWSQ